MTKPARLAAPTQSARLAARLGRYWRVVATGACFAIFGCGGLLLRIGVFPLLNLFVRDPQRRIVLSRNVIRLAFLSFLRTMTVLGVMRYQIRDRERLDRRGLLVLANHPTLIDTIFLMAYVPQANCIVKEGLWRNPFTRGPLQAAGYLRNSQGPLLLEQCIAALRGGSNLIIFPEGSRTPADGTLSFKRGAANIAVHGMRDITPVVMRCAPATLGRGSKWWRVPASAASFHIEVGADIVISDLVSPALSTTMAARHLTGHLQDHFLKESQSHATA